MHSTPAAGWYTDPTNPTQRRHWNGTAWSEWVTLAPQAAITRAPVETNHTFHLLMTVFTCGLWGLVWLVMWAHNQGRARQSITTSTGGGQWRDPLPLTAPPAALPSASHPEVGYPPAALPVDAATDTQPPPPRRPPPPHRNPSGPSA